MQQRITVLRLFCDSLVEQHLRQDNPVGRGHYVPGKAFGGVRDRKLLPHYHKLPWLPSDEEWQTVLRSLRGETPRNQVMLLLAYDGALRREELVTFELRDFDFAYRQIRVRSEHAKNGRERVVGYGIGDQSLSGTVLATQKSTLRHWWSPLFVRVTSQCLSSAGSGLLVEDCPEARSSCGVATIHHPYPTSSALDPYGAGPHGLAPDRSLCGPFVRTDHHALHSHQWY